MVSTDYVVDLTRGLVVFRSSTYGMAEVEVDYTVPSVVPADVAQAATELTRAWLGSSAVNAAVSQISTVIVAGGIYKQVSLEGESRTYRDVADVSKLAEFASVPPSVDQLLSKYRRLVLA